MNKQGAVVVMALLLAGCGFRGAPTLPPSPSPSQPTPVIPAKPSLPPSATPVPPMPSMQGIDWQASLKPLLDNLLNVADVSAGSILLVDNVQNKTNGNLPWSNATAAVIQALQQSDKFQLVDSQQLLQAKRSLGLSANDSLGSRSKAIGLARNVNAQYVLYSTATGDVDAPTITMQLMLVNTGEIIWSGSDAIAP